jgi:hypothetical protein
MNNGRPWLLAQVSCLVLGVVACGSSRGSASNDVAPGADNRASTQDAGPPAGYVRYTSSTIKVPANTSSQWFEWVAPPADHDVDIVDIEGWQSKGGHHALLYATTDIQPVGTVKPWDNQEILQGHILGGVGGEAGVTIKLPAGAVYRLHAGQALALQTHYLNAGVDAIEASSRLDVKVGEPSTSDVVASTFGNSSLTFSVPAQSKYQLQLKCTIATDVSFLMFTNHMHQWGTSATTVLTDATGAQHVLKDDPVWNAEWITDPNYAMFTVAAPRALHAGDVLTTTCSWSNTTDSALVFPEEMCAFAGAFIGDKDVSCLDGSWQTL